jgi:general secretion pathway protein G
MKMTSDKSHRRAGMTLIEVLLAIALVAMVATAVVVSSTKIFGGAQADTAHIFVTTGIKVPLTTYRIHMGNYPSTAQGLNALLVSPDASGNSWRGPYMDVPGNRVPVDPWKNPYQYRYPGTKNTDGYDVFSFGPDGVESADDIGNW